MNSTDVLILGAGPAGLSLCLYLQDRGVDSRILERSSTAGGLARSYTVGPYTFDHSGHLLHTDKPEVLNLIRDRLSVQLNRIARRSVCHVDGTFIPFPYQQNIYHLSAERIREALIGFFNRRVRNPENFEEWLEASYGSGILRQFLRPYNKKLWNVDLRTMSTDWVPRFLPSSDSKEILRSAFSRKKEAWGYNAIFYYPARGGIGTIGARLAATVSNRTSLGAVISEIDLTRRRVRLADGTIWRYGRLVSTIPLPDFLRLAGRPVPSRIRATGVTVFNVGLRRPFPHDFHWCYVPQPSIPFYRFGVYSNISSRAAPGGHSALYIECAAPGRLDRFVFSDILKHLIRMKLVRTSKDVDVVHRLDLRTAYPVPLTGLTAQLTALGSVLSRQGVDLMGRFGAWRYVAISDVIVEAGILAKKLAAHPTLR